jgi:hypothetical protein
VYNLEKAVYSLLKLETRCLRPTRLLDLLMREAWLCDGSGLGTIRHETYGPLRGCQGVNG